MYGVVLWSDVSENKAVFWCEDQGDLAFFHACPEIDGAQCTEFDAGDLVQFDIYLDRKMRKALNPRVIREKARTDLPHRLLNGQSHLEASKSKGQVVPFPTKTHAERKKVSS